MSYRDILICPHQSALTWKVHPLSPCPAITELEAVYARHGQAQAHLAESGRISTHLSLCGAFPGLWFLKGGWASAPFPVRTTLLGVSPVFYIPLWLRRSSVEEHRGKWLGWWELCKYFRFRLIFPYLCCSEHSKSLQGCLVKKEYTQNMCA